MGAYAAYANGDSLERSKRRDRADRFQLCARRIKERAEVAMRLAVRHWKRSRKFSSRSLVKRTALV